MIISGIAVYLKTEFHSSDPTAQPHAARVHWDYQECGWKGRFGLKVENPMGEDSMGDE